MCCWFDFGRIVCIVKHHSGKVMEAGPQYLQAPSKKHTQDASIEEGHHEAIAVFTWKTGNMFNQPIYEL